MGVYNQLKMVKKDTEKIKLVQQEPYMRLIDINKKWLIGVYEIKIQVNKEGLKDLLSINEEWEWKKFSIALKWLKH